MCAPNTLVAKVVVIVLVSVAAAHPLPAFGQVRRIGMLPEGPLLRAEIDAQTFSQNYRAQQMSQWCWAASISNVFAFHRHPVSQQRIVATVYGGAVNMPAMTGSTIAQQVNRVWVDDNGKRFRAHLTAAYDYDAGVYAINNQVIINELSNQRPVLVGNASHCMVTTLVDFVPGRVVSVGVFDPWPLSRAMRNLSASEMMPMNRGGQLRFLAAVRIQDLP